MTKPISFWRLIFPKKPLPPTPVEQAALDLYQARMDLLEQHKNREAANAWVTALEIRIARLEAYTKANLSSVQNFPPLKEFKQ